MRREPRFAYDDWGPVTQLDYDRDSAVDAQGSDDEYTVSYAYEKNTDGRNAIRKTGMTLPSGNAISYDYEDTSSYDDAVSRVTEVKDGEVVLCRYHYLGAETVVKTTYDEPDVYSTVCGTSAGTYTGLDELNRVIASTWTKDLATDRDFYSTAVTYDQGGNITRIEDNVHAGFDVSYTNDDVSRLTRAEEGTWSGSAITSRTRDQQWTLDHVGNWDVAKLDLNGDGDFVDADESNDDRTHNAVNELTARDVNDDETNDYTLTYDAVGNLTDDGEEHEYEYDGFAARQN